MEERNKVEISNPEDLLKRIFFDPRPVHQESLCHFFQIFKQKSRLELF